MTQNIPAPLIQLNKTTWITPILLGHKILNDLNLLHEKCNDKFLRLNLVNMMSSGLPKRELMKIINIQRNTELTNKIFKIPNSS